MKSKTNGKNISEIEVLNISIHGIWLYIKGNEYFLSYEQYPWFKDAKINEIFEIQLFHQTHIHWPKLDVDIDVSSFENPEQYPLIYK